MEHLEEPKAGRSVLNRNMGPLHSQTQRIGDDYTRPEPDQASRHSMMEQVAAHKPHPLAEEIVTASGFWGRRVSFL